MSKQNSLATKTFVGKFTTVDEVVSELSKYANPVNVAGMARFGIVSPKAFGINTPTVKKFAKHIGKNHELGLQLWKTGIHEARIIAMLISDSKLFTPRLMDDWCNDFDNWATCDGACLYVFCYSPHANQMILKWAKSKKEFSKRAAFSLIAALTVHDKKYSDEDFRKFLPLLKLHSTDERNGVRKAVNWALRQIGKRNLALNKLAIETGEEIRMLNSSAARWIAADALRELKSESVQKRLIEKAAKENIRKKSK